MPVITAPEPPFGHVARQMNKMMDQLQKGFFYPSETWTPNVNLYETDQAYLVCVDLAGVEKEKIDIELADHRLTLRGQRTDPAPAEAQSEEPHPRVRVHLMEIDHGAFAREVELPQNVEREQIKATHRN